MEEEEEEEEMCGCRSSFCRLAERHMCIIPIADIVI
jgi:hypothetical protein